MRQRKEKHKAKAGHSRMTIVAWIAGVSCLLLLAGGLWYVSRKLYRPHIEISAEEYPISGIDVSNHNGKINFRRMAADDVDFVYIKASEGVDFRDLRFSANCDSAGNAGLKVGAYHFFRMNGDGRLQSANFLASISGKMLDLPLVIDVEDWGNESAESIETVKRNLSDMIACLEAAGRRVMIYTNKDGYDNYIKDGFSHCDLWICTFRHPSKVKNFDWKILQYSHWGEVDGINGEVDLNVFNGTCEQWEAWLQGN